MAMIPEGSVNEVSFRHPPPSARPHTWWHWMNGNITKEGILKDLQEMKRVGLAGAQIFNVEPGIPAGPVRFLSPQWLDLLHYAVSQADRLGLEICLHNCAGWSSSGGPWVPPEWAMQRLTWSEVRLQGPTTFDGVVPQPPTNWGFYRDIAVFLLPETPSETPHRLSDWQVKAAFDRRDDPPRDPRPAPLEAVIRRDQMKDLTNLMKGDGSLTVPIPSGHWTILRIGYTPTGKNNHPAPPEGEGPECDKLSKEGAEVFWKGGVEPVLKKLGRLVGKTFKHILIDSYEVGCQNWTHNFRQEFLKRRGYDLLTYLPSVTGRIIDSVETTERFLWDFRKTIAELFAENYYGHFRTLCHQRGLLLSVEPYGNGPFDDLTIGGQADIPMCEFWVGQSFDNSNAKLAASIAHTYGKNIVGAEAFTADPRHGAWKNHPYSLKPLGDFMFCAGVNRFIFHRYAHQPWLDRYPGMTMGPWGFHFEWPITWWDLAKHWIDYLSRCQYLLQQGRFVADILFFVGEGSPIGYRLPQSPPPGYDYDLCDTFVLMNRVRVEKGRLTVPDGPSYAVLVLPDRREMTPALLRRIRDLVKAGATVVGPKPEKSPSLTDFPRCDEEVRRLADEVWGPCDGQKVTHHRFGKGQVFWGVPLSEVLKRLGVEPDWVLSSAASGTHIGLIHRKVGPTDLYFVANHRERWESVSLSLRVAGRLPEIWRPDTGEIRPATFFEVKGGRTHLSLTLEPYGSLFLVFRKRVGRRDWVVGLFRDNQEVSVQRPEKGEKLEIVKATYGVLSDPSKCVDVTEHLRKRVVKGYLSVLASNEIAGDPAFGIVKELKVDYLLDSEPKTIVVREGEWLELPPVAVGAGPEATLLTNPDGRWELVAERTGRYQVRLASGKVIEKTISVLPEPLLVTGPFRLRFPKGWGAPDEVVLDKLISWTEHPDDGVRYFSGTAVYTVAVDIPKEFLQPPLSLVLDLGQVKYLARVLVNGKEAGVLWKPPFQVDITRLVRPGTNTLEIAVTNLWVNRLIGDEFLPDDREWNPNGSLKDWPEWMKKGLPKPQTGRITWTTWRHYSKDSPLMESGLLGPVTLKPVYRTVVAAGKK
ncbi:MAG: glycosyl hydrolase [Armatimonadetes bacterium]|nr:glycosyl hydrolase [Armatimonadota bacterium]MDW8121778.1 glycosyl hydrolase [Armatimonadota bacterium]